MKSIILSSLSILLSVLFVTVSAFGTGRALDSLLLKIGEAEDAEDYDKLREELERQEKYLSLTLADSTLSEIEYSILEVRDYLLFGSEDEAMAAKSRLISKIRAPRRLSGFNPRSIF